MPTTTKPLPLKQLIQWAGEAQLSHQDWRRDSWEDYEFRDGKQWTQDDILRMEKLGIRPLTINRIFPVLNLLQGYYLNNQSIITAKGRTKKDSELSQVMSEALMYVGDQCMGNIYRKRAFEQLITAGIGFLGTGYHTDPRREKVHYFPINWYSLWWDPFALPLFNKEDCRYAFTADWTDIDSLADLFPEKTQDLKEQFNILGTDSFVPDLDDEGTRIEELKRYVGSNAWVNTNRNRVRPIEMWYTVTNKKFFAKLPGDRIIDLDSLASPQEEYEVIQRAYEVVSARVKNMRVCTFLGDLALQDVETPYAHDEYPYVPYVGYLDRFGFPFGVPRQIKEQDSEVNKRRSMALALLSSRRVITEEDASADLNKTYAEANRRDGFIVMRKGKMDRIQIEEMGTLAPAQMAMLEASEREIQEIAGSLDIQPKSNIRSNSMMDNQKDTSAAITASLLENAKDGDKILGEKLMSLIQDTWLDEKVLRVTDRVTGAEKFVAVNERYIDGTGIKVRNDITQARFDLVVAPAPMTDTLRQKNMDTIFAAINSAPPEAVGPLINLALEISDLPDKEQLLSQIRTATGMSAFNDLTNAEREAMEKANEQAKADRERVAQEQADKTISLEHELKAAEIELTRAKTQVELQKGAIAKQDVDQKGFQIGQQAAQAARNDVKDEVKNDKTRGSSVRGKS